MFLFFFYFQSSIVHINIVYRQTTLLRELPLMETGCLNIFSSRFSPPDPQFTSVCRQISFSVSIKFVKNNGRRSIRKKKFIKKKRIRKALSKFLTKNSERKNSRLKEQVNQTGSITICFINLKFVDVNLRKHVCIFAKNFAPFFLTVSKCNFVSLLLTFFPFIL